MNYKETIKKLERVRDYCYEKKLQESTIDACSEDILWLLNPGHGGLYNGTYQTKTGKRYTFTDHDDFTIYEGVINRQICASLKTLMIKNGDIWVDVASTDLDVPMRRRAQYANEIHKIFTRCVLLDIHSNSAGNSIEGPSQNGRGFEIWTSKGQTESDKIADVFYKSYERHLPNFKSRKDYWSDGDADKEANFYMLRKTTMPAVTLENLFFDNYKEAFYLSTEKGRQEIAEAIHQAMMKVSYEVFDGNIVLG